MHTAVWIMLFAHSVAGRFTPNTPLDIVVDYFKSHHPFQFPVYEGEILTVSVNLNVLHLDDLDETKQALTTTAWFYFVWNLKGLEWNETKYQNISRVVVSEELLWLPDLKLYNSIDTFGHLSEDSFPTTVWSNGTVEWYAAKKYVTSCKVDVSYFPFDSQRCYFRLMQWVSFSSEVNFTFYDPPITFRAFEENGEWEITDTSVKKDYIYEGEYQSLIFGLILVRRRPFYVLSMMVPISVLSALNLMVFHVPPGSGEKMTLCVSVLLSYSVYLTYINTLLPPVSDSAALFSIYLICMFVLKTLTVVASVFVLHLHSASPTSKLRQRLTRYSSTTLTFRNQQNAPLTKAASQDVKMSGNDIHAPSLPEKGWSFIVQRVDHLFFVTFLLLFLTSSSGLLCALMVS
ncbi:neuronal acetylcholine receptor subunit alpha-2-like [Haliotis asinina]|uniref:neuronal acetylcholine receptor subunit alpha-2-like n=1 Tax=Haliotis asinina TaxID=109174 RepID=UPI00353197A8